MTALEDTRNQQLLKQLFLPMHEFSLNQQQLLHQLLEKKCAGDPEYHGCTTLPDHPGDAVLIRERHRNIQSSPVSGVNMLQSGVIQECRILWAALLPLCKLS